jgi:hypothetical protein
VISKHSIEFQTTIQTKALLLRRESNQFNTLAREVQSQSAFSIDDFDMPSLFNLGQVSGLLEFRILRGRRLRWRTDVFPKRERIAVFAID